MHYILLQSSMALYGDIFYQYEKYIFDDKEEALTYLNKKLKFDTIGLSLESMLYKDKIEYIPEDCVVETIHLKHNSMFIAWFLISSDDYSVCEKIINGIKNNIVTCRNSDEIPFNINLEEKNKNLVRKEKPITSIEHYLPTDKNGNPQLFEREVISLNYTNNNFIEYKNEENNKVETNNYELDIPNTEYVKYQYVRNNAIMTDYYDLFLADTKDDRFFIKRYNINEYDTQSMIIINEYLYNFYNVIFKHPNSYYVKNKNYVYKITQNIFDFKEDTIFNTPYNVSPISKDFISYASILHYFHNDILEKENLIYYNENLYIFDINGIMLLEYINYEQNIKSITKDEQEIIEKLEHQDFYDIANQTKLKLKNCFENDILDLIINDCEKAVKNNIEYLKTIKVI